MIYSTGGVCKPFPPPLVRRGVFLVGLETKYRDIADGNVASVATRGNTISLETKYRDIADGNTDNIFSRINEEQVGNQVPRYSGWKPKDHRFQPASRRWLETKYRDIADGNPPSNIA